MKALFNLGVLLAIFLFVCTVQVQAASNVTWSGVNMTWSQPDSDSWNGATYDSGDTAQFGDTGAGTVTIDAGGVTPGAVVVNSTANYTFTGGGIGGTGSLTKMGSGTLTNATANSFSGGVFINGGTLTISSGTNLGDSGNIVTFTGSSTLSFSSSTTLSQGFVINTNVTGTLSGYDKTVTINNSLAGSGTLFAAGAGTGGGYFIFTSTNNPFSGNIKIYSGSSGSYPAGLTMVSLADSPGSRITLGNNNSTVFFNYGADAVAPLVLSNRQIEFYANWEYASSLNNNATNVNCTVTVNTDLLVSRSSAITFGLGGSNTGNNTFAGAITNKAGYVTSLTKAGTGKWILSGTNTYSGVTTISAGQLQVGAGGTSGTLGSGSVTNSAALVFNRSDKFTVSNLISGTGTVKCEGTGVTILSAANTYSGATTVTKGVLLGATGGSCSNSAFTVTNTPGVTAALGVSITNNTMQWACASVIFKTNGTGAQLAFEFDVNPGLDTAPLFIIGNLNFSNGIPDVVVTAPFRISSGLTYPLVEVGGNAPSQLPELSFMDQVGRLEWGGPGDKTLLLTVLGSGTVLMVR